ncbi:MAG TPA: hypothetical protein PLT45_02910 [Smithella sp.]|nr:hypothetical protein [Smithella sp.]
MNVIKKVGLYFANKEFCRAALCDRADLKSIFRGKLSPSVVAGLVLIVISFIIGIPAMVVVGVASAWLKSPLMGLVGIPLVYGISWLMLMLGLYLAGSRYGMAFLRWATRVILEKIIGEEAEKVRAPAEERQG